MLQYFGHLMWRANALEMMLMLRKLERAGRERVNKGLRGLENLTNSMDMRLSKLWEIVKEREAWSVAVHGVTKRNE